MNKMRVMANHITEALRYIDNAKDIVKTKLKKRDGFYNDLKYVYLAGHAAWCGVLESLSPLSAGKKTRKNVDDYKLILAQRNKKALNYFNAAYNYLHLLAGYAGDLRETTLKEGFVLAKGIIVLIGRRRMSSMLPFTVPNALLRKNNIISRKTPNTQKDC